MALVFLVEGDPDNVERRIGGALIAVRNDEVDLVVDVRYEADRSLIAEDDVAIGAAGRALVRLHLHKAKADADELARVAGDQANDAYEAALAEGRRALKTGEKTIKANPYLSIAIAAGVGVLIGKLLSRPS